MIVFRGEESVRFGKQQYPIDKFNALYHDRWFIEEDYKTIRRDVSACEMAEKSF